VEVKEDGSVHSCADSSANVDAWARGKIATWIPAILEEDPQRVMSGGDERLISDCLECLHRVLWSPGRLQLPT